MSNYVLSSIFGMATANIYKSPKMGWNLSIGLIPKGSSGKIVENLSQTGFKRKKDAVNAWNNLSGYIEIKLHGLRVSHE